MSEMGVCFGCSCLLCLFFCCEEGGHKNTGKEEKDKCVQLACNGQERTVQKDHLAIFRRCKLGMTWTRMWLVFVSSQIRVGDGNGSHFV